MAELFPPFYHIEDTMKKIEKIAKLDEEINELLIKREAYVADLKEAIKKENNTENKD